MHRSHKRKFYKCELWFVCFVKDFSDHYESNVLKELEPTAVSSGFPGARIDLVESHSGLQQSAKLHFRASEGGEKWFDWKKDWKSDRLIDGHNAAVFVYFLCQHAITTPETGTQARI